MTGNTGQLPAALASEELVEVEDELVDDAIDRCNHKLLDDLVSFRRQPLPHPAHIVANDDEHDIEAAELEGQAIAYVVKKDSIMSKDEREEVGKKQDDAREDPWVDSPEDDTIARPKVPPCQRMLLQAVAGPPPEGG
eukprot:CAMPEP_0181203180 /NCGR_PEP_ID=MMETSP1096-20121128/19245_1 /TAXON_ID=156174 ORGANISM="Chrysochromulina ericina, Strain CCMP281" /NCGR_SAMPLE_ID=MMETSP1096 /ASSEMBLY_ACC=CAM_ASM_000453 /LENGTH=136 /DNA_ID=CAMNT_0023293757 /DNA_START=388 /DNA_END=796 /DNA_ORIENTATION=+